MRVTSWQSVILSWANALKVSDEPVVDILELVKGHFFIKLLDKIKSNGSTKENIFEGDVYNVVGNFLKDEFVGFRLLGYWDSDEVTLVSSVLLLWSSLQSQDFRTPLFNLDNIVQLKIHAFLEQFVETPQQEINRQSVVEAVLDIPSDDETEDDLSCSYIASPRTYSTPKRSSQCSPGFLAFSEVRSLRGKVELLNCEKQHLLDEIDQTKLQLKETINKLEIQKKECNRLNNILLRGEEDKILLENSVENHSTISEYEYSTLKSEFKEFKEIHDKLRNELELTIVENNNLSQRLFIEEGKRVIAEQKCLEMGSKTISLSEREMELEGIISSLTKTCEEQRNILLEKRNISFEESFHYSEGETLNSIVDIKYSELQQELKLQADILEQKSSEIKKLLNEKSKDELRIKNLTEQVNDLKLLSNKQDKEVNCSECQNLKEKLVTLHKEFTDKCCECSALQEKLNSKKDQLKSLSCHKEDLISKFNTGVSSSATEHNENFNDLKEEIISLKCELYEKNNSIEYFKEEIEYLSQCLKERSIERKRLEDEHNETNTSKDREISDLMITVDHLTKEVRQLEGQLQNQYLKNEKLVQSTVQWRQNINFGNSANEELARELISLHEILEWKNLKIKELSSQIDLFKSELHDYSSMKKDLHERLYFLSEKNKNYLKEVQSNKNTITHLQSRIVSLEVHKKHIDTENENNIEKISFLETELKELYTVLHKKFVIIETELESHLLSVGPEVGNFLEFIDSVLNHLKENKNTIVHLKNVVEKLATENKNIMEKFELENDYEPATNKKMQYFDFWKKETEILCEKLIKIEYELDDNKIKLQASFKEIEKITEEVKEKELIISEQKAEIKKLNQDSIDKNEVIDRLTQNIKLYEHEKNILEMKVKSLFHQSVKSNNIKAENDMLKSDVATLGNQLQLERENYKSVEEQMNLEEELNLAFNEQVAAVQEKMKYQFEEEMDKAIKDYTRKIEHLKSKIKKDCVHIEQLSSDLWETSDRLVLAQQECEALRSQLKLTWQKADYEKQRKGIEDSNSFMWLGGLDTGGVIDEMVTITTTKRTLQTARPCDDTDEDDYDFNQQCLEDMKAGICRVPPQRLSCPSTSSTHNEESENTFVAPPDKPRKLKGTITYRKPGPPTPSANAARLSLPGNENLIHKRGLRESNSNSGQVRTRLSQLFGAINISKTKNVQESPKVKRKNFFQRTFGNRENIPPK